MIIAIEGIDGAGKNTLVTALKKAFTTQQIPVASLAFPRYEESIHAQLAAKALRGGMGDLLDSVYGMATMFALDRYQAKEQILPYVANRSQVLILDRYVASNAAYSLARLGQQLSDQGNIAQWIAALEYEQLGLPRPDLSVFLATDAQLAAQRASGRAAQDATRALDAYERDDSLQAKTLAAYLQLAAANWEQPWLAGQVEAADLNILQSSDFLSGFHGPKSFVYSIVECVATYLDAPALLGDQTSSL